MAVIFLICLIFVILDLHKIAVLGCGVQAQTDEASDGGSLRDQPESPGLLVLELNHVVVGADDLVRLVDRGIEEFRQGKPLSCHFVAVVGVHELIVVDTVWSIAFYALNCGLARVEGDDLWTKIKLDLMASVAYLMHGIF